MVLTTVCVLHHIELHEEGLGDDAHAALKLPHPPTKVLVLLESGDKREDNDLT